MGETQSGCVRHSRDGWDDVLLKNTFERVFLIVICKSVSEDVKKIMIEG